MFASTPLVPDSPVWPETAMSTSSKSSGEKLMFETFELIYMFPTRNPSSSDTPSPGRPPCAET